MRDGFVLARGGSPNFGDSLEAVTLGAASEGPPGALLGAGLAGLAGPDVRGRGRRRRRAASRLAFLPLSGEVPRTGGEGLGAPPEGVRKSGWTRA